MTPVFFYPQFKKLTGAERLILKLADYTSRAADAEVLLLTHRFADECRPALAPGVRLQVTGWPMQPTGNHYVDAAVEYMLGPALALRLPLRDSSGVLFFGPPSVPAMWLTRRLLMPINGRKLPVLYFCFEPPRFIYSDTADIVARLGRTGQLLAPFFKLYRAADRQMVRSAHRVLSNSAYGSEKIRAAYGRRATVIEHGVDFVRPAPVQVEVVKNRYDIGDRPVAVTVNHLHPRKRIDLFIRSVHHARNNVPGLVGLVVGGGPEREALERLAVDLGMIPGLDVVFAGKVAEEELASHYLAGNVYVHTGREESFGLSVIEAMWLGLPVVSVDEGGPRSTVQQGVTGCLVPADPVALGEALARLATDPASARQMGTAGSKYVTDNFSWERGAQTLGRVLGDVGARISSERDTR